MRAPDKLLKNDNKIVWKGRIGGGGFLYRGESYLVCRAFDGGVCVCRGTAHGISKKGVWDREDRELIRKEIHADALDDPFVLADEPASENCHTVRSWHFKKEVK